MFADLGYEELKLPGKKLADYLKISRPGLSILIQKGRSWMKNNKVDLLIEIRSEFTCNQIGSKISLCLHVLYLLFSEERK